ncbi:MAG: ABC transporter permease [Bacteroidaceae bacterium]|nr:ABC transporter permease [Bacteroidaceae bacterium]
MIRTILHQMWNERRINGWLFLELVAVSVFLWLAIDPLFILVSRGRIPAGYRAENLYKVEMVKYQKTNLKYRAEADNDSVKAAVFRNALEAVRKIPEVQYVGTCFMGNYPHGGSLSSTFYVVDSTQTADGKNKEVYCVKYSTSMAEGDDWPATFGLTDAQTGEPLHIVRNENVRNLLVSRSFAMEAFGRVNITGEKVERWEGKYNICGVYEDVQTIIYTNPKASVIEIEPALSKDFSLLFRIKEGVDREAFEQRFKEEYAQRLAGGNFYCKGIVSNEAERKDMIELRGYGNTFRLQSALTMFALLCAFLGVVSTFWMRANARRRDIGVMRSVGASSGRIVAQFVTEASLLVTVAFIVALPLIMHKVYAMGFADPLDAFLSRHDEKSDYIHDVAWMHFAAVSFITYIIILLVAVAGAAIPARRIAGILPSDALREE